MLLTLSLSIIIGLLLGLLGGGGSILTVPMLVYLLKVEPKTAIATAFVVIGSSSLVALIPHAKRAAVCWKSGLSFGLSGMLGAFSGGRLATHFPNELLMLFFGVICLLTGLLMIRGNTPQHSATNQEPISLCPLKLPLSKLLINGFLVGGLTGIVGIGGGFIIVPALTLLVGLTLQGAIGTSLLIIAMNSAAGLIGYSSQISLDLELTLLITAGTVFGSLLGGYLSNLLPAQTLKRSFGILVILVALYVLYQTINWQNWLNLNGLIVVILNLVLLSGWAAYAKTLQKTDRALFKDDD
jgi:uncharacterized membrane protein YfcA